MEQVLDRIATWEAAGIIDAATADRLRRAEAERPPDAAPSVAPSQAADSAPRRGPASVAQVLGPGATLGEMFAYLGGAFLLAAFEAFIARLAGSGDRSELPIAAGAVAAALVLARLGVYLRNGDARRRRAAGVMFALAVAHVGAAGVAVGLLAGLEWPLVGVIGAALATVAAIGLRLLHPSLLTQFALLVSATSLTGVLLSWLEQLVVPERRFDDTTGAPLQQSGPDPIVLIVVSVAWWLGLALIVGIVGLREADAADHDPGAGRRAALTRLWAGIVAVTGLSTSITRSELTATFENHRVIEPLIGEIAILVLAAILVERAFRRETSTYVYAAALAFMVALSDFNFAYLSSTTEVGLLIEGLILIAAGVAADRLRRRLGGPGSSPTAPQPQPAAQVADEGSTG